jgi:hypothetical protein
MTATEQAIRWSTAGAVVGVAAVAAVAAFEHVYALVRVHGEAGWTGRLVLLTVDGLIYASSTLTANVAHRLGHGLIGTLCQRGRRSRSLALTKKDAERRDQSADHNGPDQLRPLGR